MTAEERLKVRDWARRNLGEEKVNVLVSYTDYHGWRPEALDGTDHVLVHSPLNVSFWLVYPENIEEYVVDEYFDKRHAEQE